MYIMCIYRLFSDLPPSVDVVAVSGQGQGVVGSESNLAYIHTSESGHRQRRALPKLAVSPGVAIGVAAQVVGGGRHAELLPAVAAASKHPAVLSNQHRVSSIPATSGPHRNHALADGDRCRCCWRGGRQRTVESAKLAEPGAGGR